MGGPPGLLYFVLFSFSFSFLLVNDSGVISYHHDPCRLHERKRTSFMPFDAGHALAS